MTQEKLNLIDHIRANKTAVSFNVDETMQLLTHNRVIYWSWGVSRASNFNNKGLGLKVSGRYLKGWVLITLSGSDLYDIHFLKGRAKEILTSIEGIYFDELVEVIDRYIESDEKALQERLQGVE